MIGWYKVSSERSCYAQRPDSSRYCRRTGSLCVVEGVDIKGLAGRRCDEGAPGRLGRRGRRRT